MPDLIMHINYFESGYELSYAFDKVLEHGFDGIELRGASREGLSTEDYLKKVQAEMDRTGMTTVLLSFNANFMSGIAEKRQAELERWSEVLKRGIDMGVKTFNTFTGTLVLPGIPYTQFERHGSGCAQIEHYQWGTEAYQALGAIAEAGGARLAFETHNAYLHDLAKPAAKLCDMIGSPAVGVNLDMGNIVLNSKGEPLAQALEILKGKVFYLHLKNMILPRGAGQSYSACHISDGIIDNRVMLKTLKEQGFDGPIGLEAPRQGDRDYFAKVDIAYIKSLCKDLGWE